jgi:hypothetical protein
MSSVDQRTNAYTREFLDKMYPEYGPLLTAAEVADLLMQSHQNIRRLSGQNILKHKKIYGRVGFEKESVLDHVFKRYISSTNINEIIQRIEEKYAEINRRLSTVCEP